LNALDLGRHELGSVSVGINGVVANEIQFFRDTDPADQPWLTVDRLKVEHPIVELAQGASRYNAIELAGATTRSNSPESKPTSMRSRLIQAPMPLLIFRN